MATPLPRLTARENEEDAMFASSTINQMNADAVKQCGDCKTYQDARPTPKRFVHRYLLGKVGNVILSLCGGCVRDRVDAGQALQRVEATA